MNDITRYLFGEVLPALRETAGQTDTAAQKQLELWAGRAEKPLLLLKCPDTDLAARLPHFDYKEIHTDAQKMLVTEMRGALASRAGGAAAVPSVRSNMGCGIYPTLFGMEQDVFTDIMPWIQKRLSKERVAAMKREDLAVSGEFREALSQMAYMKEALEGTGVEVYPLDLQGIVDIAHLVLGDAFFYELYDDPDFVYHLMDLSVSATELGVRLVMDVIDPKQGYVAHYNDAVLPVDKPLKLSEDTTTLLSPEHIDLFAMPATRRVLERFGGGYVHFCGRNDHLLKAALSEARVTGLNLGNPDKHDMEEVLRLTARTGKVFYGDCCMRKNETRLSYFKRVIAAQAGGKAGLLLPFACPLRQREDALSDWIAAGGGV